MSTKRLARTPLEAGHYGGKNSRTHGKNHVKRKAVRAKERAVIGSYKDEDSDTHVDEPSTRTRNSDKLGAVKRWVLSQCGRPWNKVFSEIAEKFDFKTMAGRHILTHIKGYVNFRKPHERTGSTNGIDHWYPAFVNDAGILMRNRNYRHYGTSPQAKRRKAERQAEYAKRQEIKEWQKGRHLGREGGLLFWYEITLRHDIVWCEDKSCWRKHSFDKNAKRDCPHFDGSQSNYRFHIEKRMKAERISKLTKAEMAFFHELPDLLKPSFHVENGYVSTQ